MRGCVGNNIPFRGGPHGRGSFTEESNNSSFVASGTRDNGRNVSKAPTGSCIMYDATGGSMYGSNGSGLMYDATGGSTYGGVSAASLGRGTSFRGHVNPMYGPHHHCSGSQRGSLCRLGSFYGSMYSMGGGYGSMYRPHVQLGTLVRINAPYSITFSSDLGHHGLWLSSLNWRSMAPGSFYSSTGSQLVPHQRESPMQRHHTQLQCILDVADGVSAWDCAASSETPVEKEKLRMKNLPPSFMEANPFPRKTSLVSVGGAEPSIQSVVVLERNSETRMPAALQVHGDTLVLKEQRLTVNEIVTVVADTGGVIRSKVVSSLVNELLQGHNSALLISSDGRATSAPDTLVLSTLKQIMKRLQEQEKNGDIMFVLTATLCSLRGNRVRDLLSPSDKVPTTEPLKLDSSPVLGPMVVNMTAMEIMTPEDCERLMRNVKNNRSTVDRLILGTVVLKQWKNDTGKVLLSSLLVAISNDGARPFIEVAHTNMGIKADFFRSAIHGACFAVHGICLSETNNVCGEMLSHAEELGNIKKACSCSDSVCRFIGSTEAHKTGAEERKQNSSDSHAGEGVRRPEMMPKDVKGLLNNPSATTPPVDSESHYSAFSRQAAEPQTPCKRSDSVLGSIDSCTEKTKGNLNRIGVVVLADQFDGKHIRRTEDGITVGGTTIEGAEFVKISEVTSSEVPCRRVKDVCDVFARGGNSAIFSLDSHHVSRTLMESPAWAAVRQAAATALNYNRNDRKSELRASIALVNGAGMMDLLTGSGAMERLAVVSSPLFGPLVAKAELQRVRSVEAFDKMLVVARSRAAGNIATESFVVISLVLRATRDGDVIVSSFFASLAGQNTTLYKGVLNGNAIESHQALCRYALGGGPVRTILLLSLLSSDNNRSLVEAQREICAVELMPIGSGSVSAFVRQLCKQIASLKDPREVGRSEIIVKQMKKILSDHEALLQNPTTQFPMAYTTMPLGGSGSAKQSGATAARGDDTGTVRRVDTWNDMLATSKMLRAMQRHFSMLYSIAFVTTTATTTQTPYVADSVWKEVRNVLGGVLNAVPEGETVALDMLCVVVRRDELLADLVLMGQQARSMRRDGTTSTPLQIAMSPLIPPLPHPATYVRLTNMAMAEETIELSLQQAEAYREDINLKGALIMMCVLQRRQRADGDIFLSVMSVAVSGPDMLPYREMLQGTATKTAAHLLLFSLLERPYMTGCVFPVMDENVPKDYTGSAISLKGVCSMTNPSQITRSVREFIHCSKKATQWLKESGRGEKERERVERLEIFARDYEHFLKNFSTAEIPVYPSALHFLWKRYSPNETDTEVKQRNADKGTVSPRKKVPVLAVLTKRRPDTVTVTAGIDGSTISVAVGSNGSEQFVVDETVNRSHASAGIRSHLLDEAERAFLLGYNAAVLTAATNPFDAEILVAVRMTTKILDSLTPDKELFFSLVAVRGEEARDHLVQGGGFSKFVLTSSPLFGPMVGESRFRRLRDIETLKRSLTGAAMEKDAMIVLLLVLKQMDNGEHNDVVISSLLITLAGKDPKVYLRAAEEKSPKQRGLMQQALGGACFTVGMLCIQSNGENGTRELLQAMTKIATVRLNGVRHGSLRRFLKYTDDVAKNFEMRMQVASPAERSSIGQWLGTLQDMMRDATEMLRNPRGVVPKTYPISRQYAP